MTIRSEDQKALDQKALDQKASGDRENYLHVLLTNRRKVC